MIDRYTHPDDVLFLKAARGGGPWVLKGFCLTELDRSGNAVQGEDTVYLHPCSGAEVFVRVLRHYNPFPLWQFFVRGQTDAMVMAAFEDDLEIEAGADPGMVLDQVLQAVRPAHAQARARMARHALRLLNWNAPQVSSCVVSGSQVWINPNGRLAISGALFRCPPLETLWKKNQGLKEFVDDSRLKIEASSPVRVEMPASAHGRLMLLDALAQTEQNDFLIDGIGGLRECLVPLAL